MEIINYIGFENTNKSLSEKLKNFIQKFSHKKQNYNYFSVDYGYSEKSMKNNFKFSDLLIALGKTLTLIQKNFKKICAWIILLSAIYIFSVLGNKIYSYNKNFSNPLNLQDLENLEIKTLNQIMTNFALEEELIFSEDGTLQESVNDTKIEQIFSQPVTFQNYKVQSGDTISGITKKFGLKNISTIIAVNDIDNVRLISAGQTLKIPSIDGLTYTVQKGNSIQGISSKFNVTLEDLLDVNELENANLTVGQSLFIPGAKLDNESLHNALGDRFINPISIRYRLTSRFGRRSDPFTGAASNHTGIDMACPTGTAVKASMSGKVAFTGYSNIFGNYVIINHSKNYQTLYAHLSKIEAKKGQWVSQGTKIGLVGSTGYSTGPHLHFTVYKNGRLVDPLSLIK